MSSPAEEMLDSVRDIVADYETGDSDDYARGFQRIIWLFEGYDAGMEALSDH